MGSSPHRRRCGAPALPSRFADATFGSATGVKRSSIAEAGRAVRSGDPHRWDETQDAALPVQDGDQPRPRHYLLGGEGHRRSPLQTRLRQRRASVARVPEHQPCRTRRGYAPSSAWARTSSVAASYGSGTRRAPSRPRNPARPPRSPSGPTAMPAKSWMLSKRLSAIRRSSPATFPPSRTSRASPSSRRSVSGSTALGGDHPRLDAWYRRFRARPSADC